MKDKFTLTEEEIKEIDSLKDEFQAKGGMSTEELIERLNAIPLEEFMNNISKKILNYKQ